jgi:dihydrofolate reductase
MMVSIIVAMEELGGIGKDGKLPWHLPADLKRFKNLTLGHCLVMGRKTYHSIGRPLPGRTSLVISRNPDFRAAGCHIIQSFSKALEVADMIGEEQVFVIGGGEIFKLALPRADRIYLTEVHVHLDCDTFFPEYDPQEWILVQQSYHPVDEKNPYAMTFKILAGK